MSYSFFLGANCPHGFKSLFGELYEPMSSDRMYIIKGGPGTGKSSLMKRVAAAGESRGFDIEINPCSSDPDSLDGVIIEDIGVAVADGTAPHVIEPKFPGACEEIVNLGECWDSKALYSAADKIKEATVVNSAFHKKCVAFLRASSVIEREIGIIADKFTDYSKIERAAARIIKSQLADVKRGVMKKRFLSTLTPKGVVVSDAVNHFAEKTITVNTKTGTASRLFFKLLYEHAENAQLECIALISPTGGDEAEHLIFPSISLAILTSNEYHPFKSDYKSINETRFFRSEDYKNNKNSITFLEKTRAELIGEAFENLKSAKSTHDALESYYIGAMDFEKVNKIADSLIDKIF